MLFEIPKSKFNGPFDLEFTLGSDQSPSDIWCLEDGKYRGFTKLDGKWTPVVIWEDDATLFIDSKEDVSDKILYHFWSEYNLSDFYSKFAKDDYLSKTIAACHGLRVMRHLDINYGIIEGILTQNSSTRRTRMMESSLRKSYGNSYTVDLREIARASEKELQQKCKIGYRARYIVNIARKILNGGLNFEEIKQMGSRDARKRLWKIDGIGPKVADIILLFCFGKSDAFPMDRWLRKALKREYFVRSKKTDRELREFALNRFREHSGIAHLYMFYYERKVLMHRNSCGSAL